MPDRNIILHLGYDGSAYHGWQKQNNGKTVQETLEHALSLVCGEPVRVTGCGRTDARVHARNYCANFHTRCSIPEDRIPFAVNSRLPQDISVRRAWEAEADFNAIGSCLRKEYIYRILNAPIREPFLKDRVCFYPQKLDLKQMRLAASAFEGTHDFRAVRSVGTETKTTVRTVYYCRVEKQREIITISVCADGFLYNMCRAIAGTLVYAGYGKILPEDIQGLLEAGDRRLTGPTMPPQGLYLNRIWYPGFQVGDSDDTILTESW